jgi:site-specific recombinase XerD
MKRTEALVAMEREELKADHLPTTRQTYQRIVGEYCDLLHGGHVADFQGYLDYLAAEKHVSSKTVRQALNALVFFYRRVLGKDPGQLQVPAGHGGRRVPVFMTHKECMEVLSRMERVPRLQCALMYGCGLRVSEMVQLRLKDLDFESGMLTIRSGKGDKDRTVRLPKSLEAEIRDQVERCKKLWASDNATGRVCPSPVPSLERKLGRAVFGRLAWYYLFPSRVVRGDERWHATPHGVAKALHVAAEAAGIIKRISPHVWRHSYATNLLHLGTDIRTLQIQLGHSHVETTEIYTHAVGDKGTMSPLDQAQQPTNITPISWAV